MTRFLGAKVDMSDVRKAYTQAFMNVFGVKLIPWCDE